MTYNLKLKRINKDNFKDFGIYLDEPEGGPSYSDNLFKWWNAQAVVEIGTDISFGFVQPKYQEEIIQQTFEQHNETPEVLIPLESDIIITVGKIDAFDHAPGAEDFEAFLVPMGTAVILNRGVWHRAPAALNDRVNVLVIFKKDTSENDKVMQDLGLYNMLLKVAL